MKLDHRVEDAAAKLRPLAVRSYAEARGWTRQSHGARRIWVLSHPVHKPRQLLIPMDSDAPDFPEAMFQVASRLSELEGRPMFEVLSDLQHPEADTLRFCVVSTDALGGQLPLADDINLREGARRAILAAASSVVHPALHHPRLSRSQAEQMAKSCFAGQTEIGSYVFKVICPLDIGSEDASNSDYEPIVRQATRLLLTATADLVASIEQDSTDEFLHRDRTEPRVSWNLCDALLRMRPRDGGKLIMSATWAPSVKAPDAPSRVTIPSEYFPELERVGRALRPRLSPTQPQQLIATVESLDGSVGDDGRRTGDVVLSILQEDGEAVRARAELNPEQYATAVKAHMQGMGYVWVRGLLRTGTRMGRIERLTEFRVAEPVPPSNGSSGTGPLEPDSADH